MTKGLNVACREETPDELFFGSFSIVLQTGSPWICTLANGFFVEVLPNNDNRNADYWKPQVKYRLYRQDSLETVPRLLSSQTVESNIKNSSLKVVTNIDEVLLFGTHGEPLFKTLTDKITNIPTDTAIFVYADKKTRLITQETRFEEYPPV